MTTKQRAFASNVPVSFVNPLLSIVVDLVPAMATDKSKQLRTICPTCEDPTPLSQRYLCSVEGHGPYTVSEAHRAREIDKILYRVSEEEIEALKEGTLKPEDGLQLCAYDASFVERTTIPSGSIYRVRPKEKPAVYAMLMQLINVDNVAFVGEINLRGNQKLMRVSVWNNQMIMTELARPDDIAPVDDISLDYDEKLLDLARSLVESEIGTFDPTEYRNLVRERAAELDALKPTTSTGAVITAKPKVDSSNELMAVLEAAINAAKPKPKRAPRKKKVEA